STLSLPSNLAQEFFSLHLPQLPNRSVAIDFAVIPSGPIAPGNGFAPRVFDFLNPANPFAQAPMHFLEPQELAGMPADYEKQGDQLLLRSGGLQFDMSSIVDLNTPARVWSDTFMHIQFEADTVGEQGQVFLVGLGPNFQMLAQD